MATLIPDYNPSPPPAAGQTLPGVGPSSVFDGLDLTLPETPPVQVDDGLFAFGVPRDTSLGGPTESLGGFFQRVGNLFNPVDLTGGATPLPEGYDGPAPLPLPEPGFFDRFVPFFVELTGNTSQVDASGRPILPQSAWGKTIGGIFASDGSEATAGQFASDFREIQAQVIDKADAVLQTATGGVVGFRGLLVGLVVVVAFVLLGPTLGRVLGSTVKGATA